MVDYLGRDEWGATAELGPLMARPALGVTFHQSVTTATASPAADMRTLERIGVARFRRFSYCFAIHPTGVIGVGAGLTIGAHTKGHNSTRIGVVVIKQDADPLTPAAFTAAVDLLRVLRPALVPRYTVDGHRDYKATACPSDVVYRRLAAIHAAALTPHPQPEDNMPTAEEIATALRPMIREEIRAEAGRVIGWTAAGIEATGTSIGDRIRDRAAHLNPYRRKK